MRRGETTTRLGRTLRSAILLLHYMNPSSDNTGVSRCRTTRGTEYDLYEPAHAKKTFILIYGWDLAGEKDVRLARFAHAFAKFHFRVAVPCLPGLKSYTFDMKDIEVLIDLVTAFHRADESVGIAGFSAGGGIALLVAAHQSVAGMIDPLLLFSPYYSLPELLASFHSRNPPASDDKEEWNNFIWCQMVLAFREIESLSFSESEKRELMALLYNYCNEPSLDIKRQFYESALKGREIRQKHWNRSAMDEFSLHGKLKSVKSRVFIVHDSNDKLIPPHHSRRIMEELLMREDHNMQRLLVTSLLSHVTLRSTLCISDLFSMMDMVGEILGR